MTDHRASRPGYQEALVQIRLSAPALPVERVPLSAADGRVLRAAVTADRDQPPFDRATMDGYAIRAADLAPDTPIPVAGAVPAGGRRQDPVPPGACVAIATGAPVPDDLDTVIEHERSDRGRPVRFASIVPEGSAIHRRGADARAGDTLVPAGTVLGPQHLGLAAAAGIGELDVSRRPRVMILTSGDEIVPVSASPAPHEVRNSNAPLLLALLPRLGAEVVGHEHLPDEPDVTRAAIRRAGAEADVIVTVGGVSAGVRDCFPEALRDEGFELRLRGAAIQPGGPVATGQGPDETAVVCLPGNPVSVLACAHLVLWPLLRAATGASAPLPWIGVRLREEVRPNARRQAFRPGAVHEDGTATVLPWAGSGDLASTGGAVALLELPVQADAVAAGTLLRALPLA